MLQVVRLDLKVAEDGHDLTYLDLWIELNQIEQTWNVLLKIQLNLDGMKTGTVLLPNVQQIGISYLLKLINFLVECVHVLRGFLHDQVLWID